MTAFTAQSAIIVLTDGVCLYQYFQPIIGLVALLQRDFKLIDKVSVALRVSGLAGVRADRGTGTEKLVDENTAASDGIAYFRDVNGQVYGKLAYGDLVHGRISLELWNEAPNGA